jgi:hypothetical protein
MAPNLSAAVLVTVKDDMLTKALAAKVASPAPEMVNVVPSAVILLMVLPVPLRASDARSKPVSTSTVTFLAEVAAKAILSLVPAVKVPAS